MPSLIPFPLLLLPVIVLCYLGFRRRRRSLQMHRTEASERSLWVGLAASLFDSADCPPISRLEIALTAIAGKLRLRGAMISLHRGNFCRVVAASGSDAGALVGQTIDRDSVFCGSISRSGQCLAVDYASLSEWRRHLAVRERGWESYIGVCCGQLDEEMLVVSFFDSSPRHALFTRQEKALVEQLAPWIAAMVENASVSNRSTDSEVHSQPPLVVS